MVDSRSPIAILRDLESRFRQHAFSLPSQQEYKQEWVGIGFRLGADRLVAPLGEVVEILHYPALSRVPGTKAWVKGIANVRGNLLPVMDLRGFLGKDGVTVERGNRVLVVDHQGLCSGVVVDQVLGLKHFLHETHTTTCKLVDPSLAPYIRGAFDECGEQWGVFGLHRLAESTEFLQAAV